MNGAGVGGYFQVNGNPGTKAVYSGSINLNGVTSATATITAVVAANTQLFHTGSNGASGSTSPTIYATRIELTNTTTITAVHSASDANALNVGYYAIESNSGVWKSMQRGTIDTNGSTSNTATITSVDTTKSYLSHLGMESNFGGAGIATNSTRGTLTNLTTVTAQNNQNPGGINKYGYQVAEALA